MAKQLVLSNNRVLAHGEDCFLSMGGTVICTKSGRKWDNATVATYDCACPADIDEAGYEYRAGEFVPCAPFGKATGGTIPLLCDDCKTMKDSGVRGENLGAVMSGAVTLSFLPSIDLPGASSGGRTTGQGKIIIGSYLSKDGGETWEAITLPFTGTHDIAYDEKLDLFVAIKTNGSTNVNNAAYSKDGINWTATTLSTARRYSSLAAGNGMFIAGATGYVEYSTDGKTWNQSTDTATSGSTVACNDIKFDERNNLFVAVSNAQSPGKYSRDGKTWSNVGGSISSVPLGICIGNGKYILYKGDGELLVRASSALGTSNAWTAKTIPAMSGGKYEIISFANGLFFALPNASLSSAVAEMAISTDGLTWEIIKVSKIVEEEVVCDGNKFVAANNSGGVIDSYDGKNWLVRNEYRFRLPNGDDVTDVIKNILV